MPTCAACSQENRPGARYCWNCAEPLMEIRPSAADQQWLAASLAPATLRAAADDDTAPLLPRAEPVAAVAEERIMDQPTPAAPQLFAGRYELPADAAAGPVSAIDTTPWRRCWACQSTANEAGESFCIDCGAALERRSYRGTLADAAEAAGPALISAVVDESARAILPEIWDQAEDGERSLTLLHDSGRAPLAPPLDEVSALTVGASLARLLQALHAEGLALGGVGPQDLEPIAAGKVRLRDVPGLARFAADQRAEAVAADLAALAELIERLTATPRTTQRLSEDEAAEALADEAGLPTMLRQVRTGAITGAADLADRLEALLADLTRPASLRQIVGAWSDTGIVRDHNEDSYLTISLGLENNSQRQGWGVYIVSDGMGGHAAGEIASGLAIRAAADVLLAEYLTRAISPDESYSEADTRDVVRRAVLRANEAILTESRAQGNDMGATLTMALVVGDRAIVGNVGDSRTYLYRDGKLRRISKDHSLVMRLVDLGQISDEDVYSHPQRNAVLRSLGDKADVEVDLFSERLRPGDALLLCSDGQWEMTRDPEIERLLARPIDPQQICVDLVAAANQAGGEDNIASVLVRFA